MTVGGRGHALRPRPHAAGGIPEADHAADQIAQLVRGFMRHGRDRAPGAGRTAEVREAEKAHGEYEKEKLGGVRDAEWASWYAEFIVNLLRKRAETP